MALTYDQALCAARAYLQVQTWPGPEYRHVLSSGIPVSEGWYFNFNLEKADGRPLGKADELAGAPGYIVSATDGAVRVIGWSEYQKRQLGVG